MHNAALDGSVDKMITSADEFVRLRTSDMIEEQERATNDTADISTWTEVIDRYPDYKHWVVHNKTVPIEILEVLSLDKDAIVRQAVARKRKINDKIFLTLSQDKDENVRYALICNTNLDDYQLKQIATDDSHWLTNKLRERLTRHSA